MKQMTCSDYYEDNTYSTLNSIECDCQNALHEINIRIKRESNSEVLKKLKDCLSALEQVEESIYEAKRELEDVIDTTETVYEYSDFN